MIEESDDLGCYLLFLFLNIDTLFHQSSVGFFLDLSDGFKKEVDLYPTQSSLLWILKLDNFNL